MKILVIGGAGYIGRVLVDELVKQEYSVQVVDRFMFSKIADLPAGATKIARDRRDLTERDFVGFDVVFDLAAISNDPSGEFDPALTRSVNATGRIANAGMARAAGVSRYVLFSTCSVYGANDHVVDETSSVSPLTEYAKSNVLAENGILPLDDDRFCAVALRLATVFGTSPSMRFDLVVNTMSLGVFKTGVVRVTGGGSQYRPLVHVCDVVRAAGAVLQAPASSIGGQCFNIGYGNMQMREVGEAVRSGANRPVDLIVDSGEIDHRNYRVATDKAREVLGFVAERPIEPEVGRILMGLESGRLSPTPLSVRLNGYRNLAAANAS